MTLNIIKTCLSFKQQDERSKNVIKNAFISIVSKIISVIAPLLIIPMTIDYVNPTRYGIWLTISSIVSWMSILDLGLGNGLRNKLAEAIARKEYTLANQYVSTSYFSISCIVVFVLFVFYIFNAFILDWSQILKIDPFYYRELKYVAFILFTFFSLGLVFNLFGIILIANQHMGQASMITGAGQLLSLAVIFILTKVSQGSLINLALYISGIPCVLMFLVSSYGFLFTKYRLLRPKLKFFKITVLNEIFGLGFKFFIIQLCLLFVFQLTNIVLSREMGPLSVTMYEVTNRLFSLINTLMLVIMSPFWSAFTEAYVYNDIKWMFSTMRKLEYLWLLFVLIGFILLAISPFFFSIWLGDSVFIPIQLSAALLIYQLIMALSTIYVYMINGIGTIRLQLIIYVCSAFFIWPLLIYSVRYFGIIGAALAPSIVPLIQSVVARKQLFLIFRGKAHGIWNK